MGTLFYHSQLVTWISCGTSCGTLCGTSYGTLCGTSIALGDYDTALVVICVLPDLLP